MIAYAREQAQRWTPSTFSRDEMPIPGDQLKSGWGVIRLKPWHLAGIFESSIDAEQLALTLGPAYAVTYGDHVHGSPDFTFKSNPGA